MEEKQEMTTPGKRGVVVSEPTPLPHRRSVFTWLTGLVSLLGIAAFAVPFVGYFLSSLRRRDPQPVTLGKLADFPQGVTRQIDFVNPLKQPWDGMVANASVFVRYKGTDQDGKEDFMVLAANCAHLGCPVSWFPQSGLFMCPCHGGVYYADGERASGPPPRGLFHCEKWGEEWLVNGELKIQAPHLPTLQDTLTGKRACNQLGDDRRMALL
jgi:Rieske Fe-S protein